ncbi:hypothetical protein [Enhygromyxa salina]|nr:hypothetical protein [Enhygromyxa salina]
MVALCAFGSCIALNPRFADEDEDGASETGGAASSTESGTDTDSDSESDTDSSDSSDSSDTESDESGAPLPDLGDAARDGPPFDSFVDDFEDGVIDPRWSAPSCSAGCSVEESNGAMAYTLSGSQACSCTLQTLDFYSLRDDSVLLDVPAITNFHPPLRFFMAVTNANGDTIEYGFDGDDVFYAQVVVGDSVVFSETSTYGSGPRYWQIREQGGVVYFESSTDSAAWDIEMETDTPFDVGRVWFYFGSVVEDTMPSSIGISAPNYNIVP